MAHPHFAVITADKQTGSGGGLSAHIDRQVYDSIRQEMVPYQPKSVIHPERTVLNKEYILSPGMGRTASIDARIREAGIERKLKKDQVKAITFICTSDHKKMDEIERAGKLDEWVEDTLQWFREKFGKENVVACGLHMDETTPHLHITVVPILMGEAKERKSKPKLDESGKPIETKKRRYKKQTVTARLCAADLMTRANMSEWQKSYPQAMNKWGMVRGIEGHGAQRIDPAVYNQVQELKNEIKEYKEAASQAADNLSIKNKALAKIGIQPIRPQFEIEAENERLKIEKLAADEKTKAAQEKAQESEKAIMAEKAKALKAIEEKKDLQSKIDKILKGVRQIPIIKRCIDIIFGFVRSRLDCFTEPDAAILTDAMGQDNRSLTANSLLVLTKNKYAQLANHVNYEKRWEQAEKELESIAAKKYNYREKNKMEQTKGLKI